MPFLSSQLSQLTVLNVSDAIHGLGAGSTNPVGRSKINYAIGQQTVTGTVATEVYGGTGNFSSAFGTLFAAAVPTATDTSAVCNGFTTSSPLIFSPGGGSEIVCPAAGAAQGKCVISSVEIRGNPGGNVQCSFSIMGAGADYNNLNTNAPSASNFSYEPVGNTDDNNPVPYYASSLTITGSGEANLTDRITDWNMTINNNPFPIFTFDGKNYAVDIPIGVMDVSGSFSYYSSDGTFVNALTHGAVLRATFGTITLNIPYVAFTSQPTPPSPGSNAAVIRTVAFCGLAASASLPAVYTS